MPPPPKRHKIDAVAATLSDERLDALVRALSAGSKRDQSALQAARVEQRRRRRAREAGNG